MSRTVEIFNEDATRLGGYGYTTGNRLSSRLATQRSLEVILEVGGLAGRSVLDMGCGDGFYTLRFWERAQPRTLLGVDAAEVAVRVARAKRESRRIEFAVADVHQLPFRDASLDVVLLLSVLRHDAAPLATVREALRVAPRIVIHEPNRNNLGLKVIEKTSPSHIAHGEKSYSSWRLKRWVRVAGVRVMCQRFAGFVPMFCPDWLARGIKAVEPVLERCAIARTLACSVCVIVACRKEVR